MPDRPIIFSAPMVHALLAGTKTQTRRVLNPQPDTTSDPSGSGAWGAVNRYDYWRPVAEIRPYQPGDRLYVREAMHWTDNLRFVADDAVVDFDQMPEGFTAGRAHVSGMFMPRWASRLTLTVTEVRVQRLQEIKFPDLLAEGIEATEIHARRKRLCVEEGIDCGSVCRDSFHELWNSLHGPDAWDANPWICAISFTIQRGNIDQLGGANA